MLSEYEMNFMAELTGEPVDIRMVNDDEDYLQ